MPAVLFLILALLLPAPSVAAPSSFTEDRVVDDEELVTAHALAKSGKHAEAYALYQDILIRNPDCDEALMGIVATGRESGHEEQAAFAFEMLVERGLMKPENALEKSSSAFSMHGAVRTGLYYDSNVNSGTTGTAFRLGIWDVDVPSSKGIGSFGAYTGFDISLSKQLGSSPWFAVGSVAATWRGNENPRLADHLHMRESLWSKLTVGIRGISRNALVDLRFKEEIFDYEFLQHIRSTGAELTLVLRASDTIRFFLRGGADSLKYSENPDRNGGQAWAALGGIWTFADKHELSLSATGRIVRPNFHDYAFDGWDARAAVLFKLPHDVELVPWLSYGEELFHGPATALETEIRHDQRISAGIGASWRFAPQWKLEASCSYVKNASSSPLYSYSRYGMTLGVAWEF